MAASSKVLAPNGTPDNPNPEGLIPITLFPNQGGGYGYGRTFLGIDGPPEGYDFTINATVREGRFVSPSFAVTVPTQTGLTPSAAFIIPWQSSANVPYAVISAGGTPLLLQNGAAAAEADASGNTATFASACFGDDAAGTAYILAGTSTGSKYIKYRTQAGVWAASTAVGILVLRTGTHYWATQNDYQVKNISSGTNPLTGTWSAAYQVCPAGVKIRSQGAIDNAAIWGCEDGLYSWDSESSQIKKIYDASWNPDNFLFMTPDGMGGLYSSLWNGDIVHIQRFGSIVTTSPIRSRWPERDTPRGQIRAMAVHGRDVYALMDIGSRFTYNASIACLKTVDNFGTFTDYSANVIDGSSATNADLSSLDVLANGDCILIGSSEQFAAIKVTIGAANSNTSSLQSGAGGIVYSTGDGTWSGAAGIVRYDGTSASGKTMAQSGVITFTPLAAFDTAWVKATYNGIERYWVRLSVSAALDASTTITELAVAPLRMGPNFPWATAQGLERFAVSGMLPKVLRGRRVGDETVWDDLITLDRPSPAMGMSVSTVSVKNSPAGSLIITLADYVYQYPLPYTDEPSLVDFPILARDASDTAACSFFPSRWDGGGDLFELRFMQAVGQDLVTETDSLKATFCWDETNAWAPVQSSAASYGLFEWPAGSNWGRVLRTAISINDGGTTDPVGPAGREIRAWVKPLASKDTIQPARATPEVS